MFGCFVNLFPIYRSQQQNQQFITENNFSYYVPKYLLYTREIVDSQHIKHE